MSCPPLYNTCCSCNDKRPVARLCTRKMQGERLFEGTIESSFNAINFSQVHCIFSFIRRNTTHGVPENGSRCFGGLLLRSPSWRGTYLFFARDEFVECACFAIADPNPNASVKNVWRGHCHGLAGKCTVHIRIRRRLFKLAPGRGRLVCGRGRVRRDCQ